MKKLLMTSLDGSRTICAHCYTISSVVICSFSVHVISHLYSCSMVKHQVTGLVVLSACHLIVRLLPLELPIIMVTALSLRTCAGKEVVENYVVFGVIIGTGTGGGISVNQKVLAGKNNIADDCS